MDAERLRVELWQAWIEGCLMGAPVNHKRMKPKAGADPTAAERRHGQRVRAMPCLVCSGPSTLHHVTGSIHGGRITRSHQLVVPLCARHHQVIFGPTESVEALSHRGFYITYGIDLEREAAFLWTESQMEGIA